MTESNEIDIDDSNSIMIRLKQILKKGEVSITNETITVTYQFSDKSSSFAKDGSKYVRMITYDELLSLDSAINLLKISKEINTLNNKDQPNENNLYKDYQECFSKAREIQQKIQILNKFGKKFVYEGHLFFNLNKNDKQILATLEILISHFRTFICDNQDQPDFPPFLTLNNLLYFGSLLQRRKKNKILQIIIKMFPIISFNNEIFETAYQEAIKNEYIIDPMKSSIQMFSIIYKKISLHLKYQMNDIIVNHDFFDDQFEKIQKELLRYFSNHNFIVLKVNTPAETFHVLRMLLFVLYSSLRNQYFYENFFCTEDSDIQTYFSDFERNESLQTQYSFIIHPEFLSTQNQNVLKEKIISRMSPIHDMKLQKYVIITSSSDFIFGKPPADLDEIKVFEFGESSIKVNADIFRSYINKGQQFYFSIRICQSKKAGDGKSTFINKKIERITENNENSFQIFHHFIINGNQRIPIESFNCPNQFTKNIIHFQFSDEIMQSGIKFWSYLYQLYTNGFALPNNGEPMCINMGNNLVFFEIPQIRKNNQPLKSLSEFPLPISSKSHHKDSSENEFYQTMIDNFSETIYESTEFDDSKSTKEYYLFGIKSVVNQLKNRPEKQINNLKVYIEEMYYRFFNSTDLHISIRKLGYIEKYLHKYTKLYINSILSNDETAQNHFTAFFYLLTVSSFYAYNLLPNENKNDDDEILYGNGLTFVTVNDIFCDYVKSFKKKIHFYTTKSKDALFELLENFEFKIEEKYFTVCFNYDGKKPLPQDVLKNIFCSSKDYDMKIVQPFKENNPQSYISLTQMTLPTLFRSSIILSRIFLSQPIILSGDTGCGKTSSLMLLFEYFQLPINDKMYSLNIEVGRTLNCHGGITIDDIKKHLNEAPKSSKKHIIFFDELNTSPASSYIEHLLLNGYYSNHTKFVFIGALNPWRRKNPISANLTKVGLPQYIKGEEEKINLIEDVSKNKSNKKPDNVSDMMYHVHRPQEATKDIIFDFNPICYQDKYKKDDKFYPEEEKDSIHSIIENSAPETESINAINKLKKSIDICIVFIRRLMNERAVISYRDIERTMIIYNELYNHCENEGINSIYLLPMITVIISFVLRLPNKQEFKEEDLDTEYQKCSKIFQSIFDEYFSNDGKYGSYINNIYSINSRDKLISLLFGDVNQTKKNFMTFVYQYTSKYLKKKSIWKFQSTFIHIFIMDVCIRCKLPCFIIGMPGTSKSYAVELLKEQNGKNLYVSTYMSSRTSSPDGIKSQYYDAIFKEISNKLLEKKDSFCAVFIDEMGNANINPSRPLKFLHGILDHGLVLNETGYSTKVATIGVSNYTMDFANMNRGVLVYTGLPDLTEILTVFAIESDTNAEDKTKDAEEFIQYREQINKDNIKKIFDYLWPNESMPPMIALRSIYNMRYLIDNKKFDVHSLCRIMRELFNSKRLVDSGNYKELIQECPKNVKPEEYKKINNLACFLERVTCNDTQSHKSLSLFTKNYEAIEYFSLFKDDNFIEFLEKHFEDKGYSLTFEKGKFKNFKHQLFAEDFKQSPDQISQNALDIIIKCISNENENILFIGNHPCFDSCLDLLNVPYDNKKLKRDVIIGSGFSSKFKLTNTDFYIMMIANIDDLQNISTSDNPFSFAFLDRTETVYLDWEMIGEYYLKYKFNQISDANQTVQEMSEILYEHARYGTKRSDNFYTSIQSLYDGHRNDAGNKINIFENEYLQTIINERWEKGIKSVILTKSKILEEIYLPNKFSKESIIMETNTNIQDFEHLKESIINLQDTDEKLIIIKCSTFDKLHFAHLKTFFDSITDPSVTKIKYNIFIIYFGLDPKEFEGLSTFRWPIFAMEDISIHPELESNFENKEIKVRQLKSSEIESIIQSLNNMQIINNKSLGELCKKFFHNILDEIIKFVEIDIRGRSHNSSIYIKEYYDKSDYKEANHFDQIKAKFDKNQHYEYFKINIDTTNFISSNKSQLISQIYSKLCMILQPFLLFRFGSELIQPKPGMSDIEDFLLKCIYLDLPFNSFLRAPDKDPFNYLFMDYLDFLINNKVFFDDDMLKFKFIADKIICAMGSLTEVKKIFNDIYEYNFQNLYNKRVYQLIFESEEEIDNEGKDEQPIYLQQYTDYLHFRSFAGLNVKNHQTNYYWDTYFNHCIFPKIKRTAGTDNSDRGDKKKLNRSSIIKSICEYRNKSIFDIFISPIEHNEVTAFESDICKKLIRIDDFETTLDQKNSDFQIIRKFNENTQSLKSGDRVNQITEYVTEKNKKIIMSIELPYVISNWDGENANDAITKFKGIENITLDDFDIESIYEYTKINKLELNFDGSKYQNFGEIWKSYYKYLEWNFKGDCLIDEIQSILNKGSAEKPEFRKWLFSGFESDEPLSIIAFRRYLSSQIEYETDFAKVLDPLFGDIRIIKLFINYINNKIPGKNSFPIGKITEDDEAVMSNFTYRSIFKFSATESDKLFRIDSSSPYLAQFIWFHITFNKPSDYPLTSLLIQKSAFFIDFQVVPKIIYSIIHLRHIFSYNPVFIPIILHCTSLFDDCECKLLLYSLNYFDLPNKEFANIQKELGSFKEFLQQKYAETYDYLRKRSSYDQIEFILKIYFKEYNKIVEKIYEYSNKRYKNDFNKKLKFVNVCDILPNMLLTNWTLTDFLLPILYKTEFKLYSDIEDRMCRIFAKNDCIISFHDQFNISSRNSNTSFPLVRVSFENDIIDGEAKVDFLGFSKTDYQNLFQHYLDIISNINIKAEKLNCKNNSLNFHASVLLFFQYLYLNTIDDDTSKYDDKKDNNDISNCHMNTYSNNNRIKDRIDYSLNVNEEELVINKNKLGFAKGFTMHYDENKMYPLQGIFKLLPVELRNKIREYQDNNKNGLLIIESEEKLNMEEIFIEEEEEVDE